MSASVKSKCFKPARGHAAGAKACALLLLAVGALCLPACGGRAVPEDPPLPDAASSAAASAFTSAVPVTEAAAVTETAAAADVAAVTEAAGKTAAPPTELRSLGGALAEKADAVAARYGAVGVQAAVARGGAVRYTYEYGAAVRPEGLPVTKDTKFRVASLSKFVTETVFLRLVDEGRAAVDGNVETYLGCPVRNPSYPDTVITPAMLMTHSSSLLDSAAFLEGRQNGSSIPLAELLRNPSSYSGSRPGTAESYSNFGVAVLGAACEKLTGASFERLASEYVFTPLGIDAAYTASALAEPSLLGELYGQGGLTRERQLAEAFREEPGQTYHLVQGNLTVSAADYLSVLCRVWRDAFSAGQGVLLSKESAAAMFRPQFADEGFGQRRCDSVIDGLSLCCHTGSNFGMFAAFAFSPETGDGVVVLTSGADTGIDPASDIYQVCLDYIRLFYANDALPG